MVLKEDNSQAITLFYLSKYDLSFLYVLIAILVFVTIKLCIGIVLAVNRHIKEVNVEKFYFSQKSRIFVIIIQLTFLFSGELQEIRVIGNNVTFLLSGLYHFLFMIVFYQYWKIIWTSGCRSINEYIAKRYRDPLITFFFKIIALYHSFSYFGILYKEEIENFKFVGLTEQTKGIEIWGIFMLTAIHCFSFPAIIFGGVTLVSIFTVIDFVGSFLGIFGIILILNAHGIKMITTELSKKQMWFNLNKSYLNCGQQYLVNILFYGLCCPLGFDIYMKAAIKKRGKMCIVLSQSIRIVWMLYLLLSGIIYYSHYQMHHPDAIITTAKKSIDWLTSGRLCSIESSAVLVRLYSLSVTLALIVSLSREYGMHMLSTAKQFRTDILSKLSLGQSVHPDNGVYGYWSTLFCAGAITTIMTILCVLSVGINYAILDKISRVLIPMNLSVMIMAPIFSDITALGIYVGSLFSLIYSFYMARFFENPNFHKSVTFAMFNNSSYYERVSNQSLEYRLYKDILTKDNQMAINHYIFDFTPISAIIVHIITSIFISKLYSVGYRNKEIKFYFERFAPQYKFKPVLIYSNNS